MQKIIRLKIFNNSDKTVRFSGYLKLNEIDLVDCNPKTIEKEIEIKDDQGKLIWRRTKMDPMEEGVFILKLVDSNELIIQNAPFFEGVKVKLNNVLINGDHKYKR